MEEAVQFLQNGFFVKNGSFVGADEGAGDEDQIPKLVSLKLGQAHGEWPDANQADGVAFNLLQRLYGSGPVGGVDGTTTTQQGPRTARRRTNSTNPEDDDAGPVGPTAGGESTGTTTTPLLHEPRATNHLASRLVTWLVADHGYGYTSQWASDPVKYPGSPFERLLPVFGLFVPKQLLELFDKKILEKLEKNRQRLVSGYDFHLTTLAILQGYPQMLEFLCGPEMKHVKCGNAELAMTGEYVVCVWGGCGLCHNELRRDVPTRRGRGKLA